MAVLDIDFDTVRNKKKSCTQYKFNFWGASCSAVVTLFSGLLMRCCKKVCIVDFTPERQVYAYFGYEINARTPVKNDTYLTCMVSDSIKSTDFSEFDVVICCNGYAAREETSIMAAKGSFNYLVLTYEIANTYACMPILENFHKPYDIIVKQDVGDLRRRESLISVAERNEKARKLLQKVYFLPFNITDRRCEMDANYFAIMRYRELSSKYVELLVDMGLKMDINEFLLYKNMK